MCSAFALPTLPARAHSFFPPSPSPTSCLLWLCGAATQVYTYLLRPLTGTGRQRSGQGGTTSGHQTGQRLQAVNSSDSGTGSSAEHTMQAAAAYAGSLAASSRQGSGSEAIVGYQLQLVMDYCPLVRASKEGGGAGVNAVDLGGDFQLQFVSSASKSHTGSTDSFFAAKIHVISPCCSLCALVLCSSRLITNRAPCVPPLMLACWRTGCHAAPTTSQCSHWRW